MIRPVLNFGGDGCINSQILIARLIAPIGTHRLKPAIDRTDLSIKRMTALDILSVFLWLMARMFQRIIRVPNLVLSAKLKRFYKPPKRCYKLAC